MTLMTDPLIAFRWERTIIEREFQRLMARSVSTPNQTRAKLRLKLRLIELKRILDA